MSTPCGAPATASRALARPGEIRRELIEGAAEALLHRAEHVDVGLAFFLRGIDGPAAQHERRLAGILSERDRNQDLEWKRIAKLGEGRPCQTALGVRERVDEDEALRRRDLAVDEAAPHVAAR